MYRLHHNGRRWFRDLGPVGGWWLSACKGLAAFRALDLVWLGHACPVVVVVWPSNNAPAQEVQGWRGGPAQATPAKEVDLPAGTGHLASMPLRPLSGGFLRALSSTRPLARDSHPGTNTVRKARHSSFQDAPLLFLYYWPRFNFCCLKDSEREVGERSASLIASPPVVPFPHVVEHMAKGRDGGADAAPDYCTCSVGTGV